MKGPVVEWQLVIHHGFSRTKSVHRMGVEDVGKARALEAAERWATVSRHADDDVSIESREVHPWRTQSDQLSLNT